MPPTLDIDGHGRLAVGKIVAVGKNYEEHRREMAGLMGSGAGGDVAPPADPVLFLKPATSILPDGGAIEIPAGIGRVDHEVELAVVVGRAARRVPRERALDHVAGYAVANDVTARDLQAAAKRAGLPWTLSKGYETFCPLSRVAPAGEFGDPHAATLELALNGATRQKASTGDMIHRIDRIIEHVSGWTRLEPGDVVLTGTPAGVGPMRPGDVVESRLTPARGPALALRNAVVAGP